MTSQEAFHELSYYTLSRRDPSFIHQNAVDAYAAQNAGERSKPIQIFFALACLYLHVEKSLTGLQVQKIHMRLACARKPWPRFPLPAGREKITVFDVLAIPAGPHRDSMIRK